MQREDSNSSDDVGARPSEAADDQTANCWARADSILSTEVCDEQVLMSVERKHYAFLNSTASAVWNQLTGPMSVDAIVTRLKASLDIDTQRARREVLELLEEMATQGLVVASAAAGAAVGSVLPTGAAAPQMVRRAANEPNGGLKNWIKPALRMTSVALTADLGSLGSDYSKMASGVC